MIGFSGKHSSWSIRIPLWRWKTSTCIQQPNHVFPFAIISTPPGNPVMTHQLLQGLCMYICIKQKNNRNINSDNKNNISNHINIEAHYSIFYYILLYIIYIYILLLFYVIDVWWYYLIKFIIGLYHDCSIFYYTYYDNAKLHQSPAS